MALICGCFYTLVLCLAAHQMGRLCLSKYEFEIKAHPSLHFSICVGLGYVLIFFDLLILTFLGWVYPVVLWAFFGLLCVLAFLEVYDWTRSLQSKISIEKMQGIDYSLGALVLFICVGVCFLAALPETARDSIIYHLEIPKTLLETHGSYSIFKDNIYAFFPQFGELLMMFGLGTFGEVAAKLTHTLFFLLTILALYGFVRERHHRSWSLFAVLIFASVPSVMVISSWAYVDLIFTFYFLIAYYFMIQYLKCEQMKIAILWGIFAGVTAATKYTGLQLIFIFLIVFLLYLLREKKNHLLKGGFFFALTSGLIVLPFLLRNYVLTGWPLFPFQFLNLPLRDVMNWNPERAELFLGWLGSFGAPLGKSGAVSTMLAPIFVFVSGQFENPTYYDGVLGAVFLFVPLLVLIRQKIKPSSMRSMSSAFFCFIFVAFWMVTTKQARFLIPILPLMCYVLVSNLARIHSKGLCAVISIFVLINGFTGVQYLLAKEPLPYLLKQESRQGYLLRQMSDHYAIYEDANKLMDSDDRVYLMNSKNYGYFLEHDWRSDFIFERYSFDLALQTNPSEDSARKFFEERGITHLMVDEAFIVSPEWGMDPEALTALQNFMRKSGKLLSRRGGMALYSIS